MYKSTVYTYTVMLAPHMDAYFNIKHYHFVSDITGYWPNVNIFFCKFDKQSQKGVAIAESKTGRQIDR